MMEAMETIYEMLTIQVQYDINFYILFSMYRKCLIIKFSRQMHVKFHAECSWNMEHTCRRFACLPSLELIIMM
jgi:hypothetical protein